MSLSSILCSWIQLTERNKIWKFEENRLRKLNDTQSLKTMISSSLFSSSHLIFSSKTMILRTEYHYSFEIVMTWSELFSSSSFSKQLFIMNFLNENFTCDHRAFLKEDSDLFKQSVWDFLLFFIFLIFQSFFNILTRAWTFKINRHVISLCWFRFWCWEFFINWKLSREESSVIRMMTCFFNASRTMFLSNWSLLRKAKAWSRWLLNLRDFRVSNSNWSDRQFHYWKMIQDDCCCLI